MIYAAEVTCALFFIQMNSGKWCVALLLLFLFLIVLHAPCGFIGLTGFSTVNLLEIICFKLFSNEGFHYLGRNHGFKTNFEEMGKEESPQVIRRTTRSSATSTPNSHNLAEPTIPSNLQAMTLDDLTFGDEPISFEDLISSFPGRRIQVHELIGLMGPLNSPMIPLFVYGGASTGKTSVVLQVFRHLNRPFVYSSCRTCYSPRILFESILNQLLLHRKDAGNGYSSAKRCEKPSDFVNLLREALLTVVSNLKGDLGKSSLKKKGGRVKGKMVYLVIDNLELLRQWDKSATILPFLFKLYDILNVPEVGFVFISSTSPDTYYLDTGYVEPIPVYFPDYTEDHLREIFMRNQANPKLYSSFLE